ncbi:MAG: hypothetical protein NTY12_01030 [Candidatus Falkowbacteria bacterium]|nr:hypothetical protein [Candidatus Falkowbacteria bacterium]
MKRILLVLFIIVIGTTGCSFGAKNSLPVSALSKIDERAQAPKTIEKPIKNYELYEGNIWDAKPENCSGDILCLEKYAKDCALAKGVFSASYIDSFGNNHKENYELGIQGIKFSKCQMYFKILSKDGPETNYQMCRFDSKSDLVDVIKDSFINDVGLFTSEQAKFPVVCIAHRQLDNLNKINSVNYSLVKGEAIEDATQNLRIILKTFDLSKAVTFTIIKDSQKEDVTILLGEEKTILGYKIKLLEFGEKNVGLDKNDMFEPMVNFYVSQ